MKLPYGISNFAMLVRENYFFMDRTSYIELLENEPEHYLFFLRPRRFGKSLFISVLSYYYGLEHKAKFQELFGQYYIGKHPTPKANSYYVLKLEFSRINTETPESTKKGFLFNVLMSLQSCEDLYGFLPQDYSQDSEPAALLKRFFKANKDRVFYVLIDEYDHFANELLGFHFEHFSEIVSRNGFVRKFYEVIKEATGDGIVERLFVTGVSPITLDSMTSGFNIGRNFSLNNHYHKMLGFTEEEITSMLKQLPPSLLPHFSQKILLADLKKWYNGYLFHPKGERLYNPDMVLFFLTDFIRNGDGEYPERMLDPNIASDYGKLRRLFDLRNRQQNYDILDRLMKDGCVISEVTIQFSFEKHFTTQDFVSLLFYMGLISLEEGMGSRWKFKIPNYVMEGLYLQFFAEVLEERSGVENRMLIIGDALHLLAYENQPRPFLELIEAELKALSNRDFIQFDEKYVQLLFVTFARLSDLYFVQSQREVSQKYPDVMLLHRPPFFPTHQFLLEFKYLKKSDESQLDTKLQEGISQLQGYLQHEEIQALAGLKSYVVVFVGCELREVREIV
ncbi:MAG: AAA family ATPase [SAR324 cluster bacterium]|nr:AAA family ATPase [SAR324 cluster bacterium]